MAEGQATTSSGTLTEHNCAIQPVAERFPEICAAEARFLERGPRRPRWIARRTF